MRWSACFRLASIFQISQSPIVIVSESCFFISTFRAVSLCTNASLININAGRCSAQSERENIVSITIGVETLEFKYFESLIRNQQLCDEIDP